MVSCENHPDRDAVIKCRRCSRNFCDACVDKAGNFNYCFDCLKGIARESKEGVKRSVLTPLIAVGAILSGVIGLALIWVSLPSFASFVAAAQSGALRIFLSSGAALSVSFSVLGVILYLVLAFGLVANKSWALIFGVVLNVLMFFWALFSLIQGRGSMLQLDVLTGAAVALIIVLVMNRKQLSL